MKQILVTRSSMPDYEEYCEEIKKLWDSHWLTNMGVEHEMLQQELERFLGCPHVVLYTNGHLALENVIAAMVKNDHVARRYTTLALRISQALEGE